MVQGIPVVNQHDYLVKNKVRAYTICHFRQKIIEWQTHQSNNFWIETSFLGIFSELHVYIQDRYDDRIKFLKCIFWINIFDILNDFIPFEFEIKIWWLIIGENFQILVTELAFPFHQAVILTDWKRWAWFFSKLHKRACNLRNFDEL